MLKPADLTGVDETLARRILAVARSIAPGIDDLVDGEGENDPKPRTDAIAILSGVAAEAPGRGPRHVQSQGIGPARVTYRSVESWFSPDDRAALRALCGDDPRAGGPVGSFPSGSAFGRVWPEVP